MDFFVVVVLRSLTHTYYVLVAENAKSNNINPCLRATYGNRRRNGKLYSGWQYHLWVNSVQSESPSRQGKRKAGWWELNKILGSQRSGLRYRAGLHFPERTGEQKKILKQKFSNVDQANTPGSREKLQFNDHIGIQTCLYQAAGLSNNPDFRPGDF